MKYRTRKEVLARSQKFTKFLALKLSRWWKQKSRREKEHFGSHQWKYPRSPMKMPYSKLDHWSIQAHWLQPSRVSSQPYKDTRDWPGSFAHKTYAPTTELRPLPPVYLPMCQQDNQPQKLYSRTKFNEALAFRDIHPQLQPVTQMQGPFISMAFPSIPEN